MTESEDRPVRNRAETRQLWVERLQRFAQGQFTVVAFCQQEGISAQAFYYWKHKLHPQPPAPDDTPRLLPVRLLDAAPAEVVLPNRIVLRLAPGCDLHFVRSLVAALGEAPC
jgi:transposase